MKELFSDIPEAIDNTNMIVDRVEVLNLKKDILLPAFTVPDEFQHTWRCKSQPMGISETHHL